MSMEDFTMETIRSPLTFEHTSALNGSASGYSDTREVKRAAATESVSDKEQSVQKAISVVILEADEALKPEEISPRQQALLLKIEQDTKRLSKPYKAEEANPSTVNTGQPECKTAEKKIIENDGVKPEALSTPQAVASDAIPSEDRIDAPSSYALKIESELTLQTNDTADAKNSHDTHDTHDTHDSQSAQNVSDEKGITEAELTSENTPAVDVSEQPNTEISTEAPTPKLNEIIPPQGLKTGLENERIEKRYLSADEILARWRGSHTEKANENTQSAQSKQQPDEHLAEMYYYTGDGK